MKSNSLCVALIGIAQLFVFEGAKADTARFFTPVEVSEPRTPISFAGSFSLGLSFDSSIPLSQPFVKTTSGGSAPFRFQVPSSTKLDISYGFSPRWELGLSLGYLGYESRFQSSPNQIETASFKSFPLIEATARYYMNFEQGIAGEFESGFGLGFGQVTVSSTDSGSIPTEVENVKSMVGHAALGMALGWAEGYSAHFLAGMSVCTLSSKTFAAAEVQQSGSLTGLYVKGGLRLQF